MTGALFQKLIDSSVDGIFAFDRECRYTVWNPAMEQISGLGRADVLGKSAFDVFPFFIQTGEDRYFHEALAGKTVNVRDRLYVNPQTGQSSYFEGHYSPLFDETGEVIGGLGVIREFTQHQSIEYAEPEQGEFTKALREITIALNSTLDLDELLDCILVNVRRVVSHDRADIMLIEGDEAEIVGCRAHHEQETPSLLGMRLSLAHTPNLRWMAESGQPLAIPDIREYPEWVDIPETNWIRSYAGAPICIKKEAVGFLNLVSMIPGFFTQTHAERLQAFADQAAIAIFNARLFKAERQQRELAERLQEASTALTSALEYSQVLDSFLLYLEQVLPYDSACVFLVEGDDLHVVAARGFSNIEQVLGSRFSVASDALIQELQQTRQPICLVDAQVDPRFHSWNNTDYVHGWLGIPLIVRGELIGHLTIDSRQVAAYGQAEAATAQALANQAAIAIDNARLHQKTSESLAQITRLYELSTEFVSTLSVLEVANLVIDKVVQATTAHSAVLNLLDESGNLVLAIGSGSDEAAPRPSGTTMTIFKTGQPLIISDIDQEPGILSPELQYKGFKASIGLPLKTGERTVGVLFVRYAKPHHFSGRELETLFIFANQAAIAIENARLYQAERASRQQAQALHRAALTMVSTVNLDEVIDHILTEMQQVIPYDSASVQLLKGDYTQIIGGRGFPNPDEILGHCFSVKGDNPDPKHVIVIGQKKPVIIADTQVGYAEFFKSPHSAANIRSWVGVPMLVGDRVIGMITLDKQQPNFYSENHVHLASAYAAQAAIAIENARLYQAEKTSRQETQALHRAVLALVSTIDLKEVIERILIELESVVPYDSSSVQLLKGDYTEIIGGRGFPDLSRVMSLSFDVTDESLYPLNFAVVKKKKPVIVTDAQKSHPQYFDGPHEQAKVRSWLGVPMLMGEQVVGMISLDKQQPNFYTEAHAHLASAYAAQAAIAVENARLYQQAQDEIAERKRAEAELNAYQERLEELVYERTIELESAMAEAAAARDRIDAILRSVADGLIVTDLEHKVIMANPAAETLLGLSRDDMVGRPIGVGLKDNRLQEVVQHTLEQNLSSYETDLELVNRNGQKKVMRTRTALVGGHQQGHPLGTVTLIQDVTRWREADRLKTQLLNTVAHELRTPLTSILGFSEILLSRDLSQGRQLRFLHMINDQSIRISEIVNDLIDVSRLEAGRGLDLNLELVYLNDLMDEVVAAFAEESMTSYEFQTGGFSDLPPIMGDSFRLVQVGRNLVSNAIKYSPQGGKIIIKGKKIPGYVEITVKDHGIGMTPEQQSYLFEPFYRVDTSNTAVEGAGLGLAISKLVIEQHGGRIWIESEWGKGTTVYFTLPLVK